jgi:hypothetical protein
VAPICRYPLASPHTSMDFCNKVPNPHGAHPVCLVSPPPWSRRTAAPSLGDRPFPVLRSQPVRQRFLIPAAANPSSPAAASLSDAGLPVRLVPNCCCPSSVGGVLDRGREEHQHHHEARALISPWMEPRLESWRQASLRGG